MTVYNYVHSFLLEGNGILALDICRQKNILDLKFNKKYITLILNYLKLFSLMSCFSYAGAEDLDTLVSQEFDLSDNESSNEVDSDSSDSLNEISSKKILGKRKKVLKNKKPNKKKQKENKTEESQTNNNNNKKSSKLIEVIGLLSDDDDDDLDDLSADFTVPSTSYSDNRVITGALLNIQLEILKNL